MFDRNEKTGTRVLTTRLWPQALMILATLFGLLSFGASARAATAIVSIPVTFQVVNVNRSLISCPVDRKSYEIHGHLVGPRDVLAGATPEAVTMYLHGIGWGEFYWHFTANSSYDYASQMARLGHVSLTYDQLGYGASGRPNGLFACYGGEADIARQIADALRAGSYVVAGRAAPKFNKVALASQQAEALTAEPAVYSFAFRGSFDALILTSFAENPLAFKPAFALQAVPFFSACALGGSRSDGTTGPKFYVNFPVSDAAFRNTSFANADPAVVATALALRGRSPCGEGMSAFTSIGVDTLQLLLRQIKVPVLLVNGLDDALFRQPAGGNLESLLFKGSDDVTAEFIANAGQALALERTAGDFRRVMHDWLAARGF